MDHFRLFVAISLEEAVRKAIARLIGQLMPDGEGVRWIDPKNLHLTLAFLGDAPASQTTLLAEAIGEVAARHLPFELGLAGVGAFPQIQRPRVIWVGVAEGAAAATRLRDDLQSSLVPLGYHREERAFSPHVTIGRVKFPRPSARRDAALRKKADWIGGDSAVDSIELMASELSRDGARYRVVSSHPLGGNG